MMSWDSFGGGLDYYCPNTFKTIDGYSHALVTTTDQNIATVITCFENLSYYLVGEG